MLTIADIVNHRNCKSTVLLDIDYYKSHYITLEQKLLVMIEDEEITNEEFEELSKADHLYNLVFYPDTPIGSYSIFGANEQEVLEKAMKVLNEL